MEERYDFTSADGSMRYVSVVEPISGFAGCLVGHVSNPGEQFDEVRTGLDHLEFLVARHVELQEWADRLDELGIAHSGVKSLSYTDNAMLTFRDPDTVRDRDAGVGGLSLADIALPAGRRERRHRAGPRRGVHPGRTGLVVNVGRPGRAGQDAERARPRAVGSRGRVGVRDDRAHRRPAGVRTDRLDATAPWLSTRSGGPQPGSPSGRHRPHRGRRPADLRADGMAGAHRPRTPHDRPDRPDPRRRGRCRFDRRAARPRCRSHCDWHWPGNGP